ncbi:MAG TPA: TonB-dependent receptor [Nevskiaceae bacterium]|nr:TonB-dependent receptor [Nevskiaceae bacterium]
MFAIQRGLLLLLLLCVLLPAQAAGPAPGEVLVLVRQEGASINGLAVLLDGADIASTDGAGTAVISTGPGEHTLVLNRGVTQLARETFRLEAGQAAEWLVRIVSPGAPAETRFEAFPVERPGTGTLLGYVTDELGNTVAGASVQVDGSGISTTSNAEGYFEIAVPRGVYEVTASAPGKPTRTQPRVRVTPLLSEGLQLVLSERRPAPTGGGIEEVVATARYVPDTATALERTSDTVLDAISAADIAIAGDSDAASALQRVTGVTIVNDLVFVRGLGDRYSAAYVNGAEVPSPDPSRRAISLELFPTDLIGGIQVQKTYSAELPGDFSGGAVLIDTVGLPDEFNWSVGLSSGGNSRSTGLRGLSYDGGSQDWLGRDDGTRAIPALAAGLTNGGRIPLSALSSAQVEQVGESLPNIWDVEPTTMEPDSGFSFGLGGRSDALSRWSLGYQAALLYDRKTRFRSEERNEPRANGDQIDVLYAEQLERTEQNVDTGGIVSFAAEYDDAHRFEYSNLLTRQTTKGVYTSTEQNFFEARENREFTLDWIENALNYQQLAGSHEFAAAGDLGLSWQVSLSDAVSDVLDRRQYSYTRVSGSGDAPFEVRASGDAPLRSWEFLDEETLDYGLALTLPWQLSSWLEGEIQIGARDTRREREFQQVLWRFLAANIGADVAASLLETSLESVLLPQYIRPGDGWVLRNSNTLTPLGNADSYSAEQDGQAAYVSLDAYATEQWRLQLGVREESARIQVGSRNAAGDVFGEADLDERNLLPAVTLSWIPNDEHQLRVAYSETVNRPQFRELAPVAYRDPETRQLSAGNPALQQAEIVNYDLRYEYYWAGNEGLTAALFFKEFTNPIEVVLSRDGNGAPLRTFANARSAEIYGLELDLRWEFDELAPLADWLQYLYFAGNLSLIESEVDASNALSAATNPTRPLQGQSPWIVNTTFGWSNPNSETDIALLLNMFGERITEAGLSPIPDALEQPYPLVDLNLRQQLGDRWKLGFKVRNLFDPQIEVSQGPVTQRRYRLGTSGSFSVEYKF